MNKDQVKGRVNQVKGKLKEETGKALDDPETTIKGKAEKTGGMPHPAIPLPVA